MSRATSPISDGIEMSGSVRYILVLLCSGAVGYLFHVMGWFVFPAILFLPILLVAAYIFFKKPKVGLFVPIVLISFSSFLGRHLPIDVPYGLLTELFFVAIYVILFFKHFKYLNFRLAQNDIVLLMVIWMFYIMLQLANPLAASKTAWFYAMRAIALLQLMVIPLVLVLLNNKRSWKQFIIFWLVLSLIALLWGLKQNVIGVTEGEQQWLNEGAYKTHLLYGRTKLRVFSIFSDAGTFGASMSHIGIVALILALGPYRRKTKIMLFVFSFAFFLGMIISGTRGAIIIPVTGALVYLIMVRNYKYILLTAVIMAVGFSFLKFTHIGSGVYEIYRLRTALDPEDASLQVRLHNRDRLTEYLRDKPFGGGVGSTGRKGQRFSPDTWLANFPPDGLYTMIRAETGVVGKYLYLFIWIYILVKGMIIVFRMKSREHQNIGTALLAGYAGILAANYGNPVMTLYPTNLYTFISLGIVFSMQYWNKDGEPELKNRPTPKEAAVRPSSYIRGTKPAGS